MVLPRDTVPKRFTVQTKTKGMVTELYQFLVIPDRFSLPVEWVWERDCPELDEEFDWHDVWSEISQVSCNPDHQQIHYNFIHRTYLAQREHSCDPLQLSFLQSSICSECMGT